MTLVRRLPLEDGVLLLILGNFTQEDLEVSDKGKSLKDFRYKLLKPNSVGLFNVA